MLITAVIPTLNRSASLRRTLQSLLSQSRLPDEIIVVDASDGSDEVEVVKREFAARGVMWIHTSASVCLQRNTGIRRAAGEWIFLCDDDIELNPDYILTLETYVSEHVSCGAVAGRLLQLEQGIWTDQYPVRSFGELLWRFLFQLPVWGEIDRFRVPVALRPVYNLIQAVYRSRGNTVSLAGWPLITEWSTPAFQTTTYALGASLIRKEWLRASPYDETLDPSGIGDNYGVALGLPSMRAIHVISSALAYHHRAAENRMGRPLSYYRRVVALHYFLLKHRVGYMTIAWLAWSLTGNAMAFFFKGDREMFRATLKAMSVVMGSGNPYWKGYLVNQSNVAPRYNFKAEK